MHRAHVFQILNLWRTLHAGLLHAITEFDRSS